MAAPSTQAKTNTFKTILAVSLPSLDSWPFSQNLHRHSWREPHPPIQVCRDAPRRRLKDSDLARERDVCAQHHPSLLWPSHGQPSTRPSTTEKGGAGTREHSHGARGSGNRPGLPPQPQTPGGGGRGAGGPSETLQRPASVQDALRSGASSPLLYREATGGSRR